MTSWILYRIKKTVLAHMRMIYFYGTKGLGDTSFSLSNKLITKIPSSWNYKNPYLVKNKAYKTYDIGKYFMSLKKVVSMTHPLSCYIDL